ncbi:spore coat protein U domain-containing protein [Polaromonas sp. SM01]|uniref:spore coat protein U domain-containing protein n=1 Tax=Polaromonas sp. SM01 TaxID=3085630 RepID=UPI002981FC64|nr:spore coat protein U domain-containing protein [Polaromonas sp. SM01]MDW5442465.1 spore coat protein U domain-containing protein [Polaromonas sp. SM01]
MTRFTMKTLPILALLLGSAASHATITCNIFATGVTGIYDRSSNLDLTGSISVNCTRAAGDPTSQVLYIGIDQGEDPSGRDMTRQTGTDLLRYFIYRNPGPANQWTTAAGKAPGSGQNGGLQFTLNFGAGTSASVSYPYYFRVRSGITRPAGIYDDVLITAFLRTSSSSGPLIANVDFTANASILSQCYLSSLPLPLTLNYTSFSPSPQTGATSFGVSCTLSTPYTMALDATSGTLLGLNYTLALSSSAGTGTGFGQTYNVTGTIPANQVGTCTLGSCSGSQARTVTITY